MTPEQIEQQRTRDRVRRANMTPEQRERKRAKNREYTRKYRANMTSEEIERNRERQRVRRANRTPEKLERDRERQRERSLKAWTNTPPEQRREQRLVRLYGITKSEHDAMLVVQKGACRVCGTKEPGFRGWHVDHVHDITQKVRGILCNTCNTGLGLLKDDPDVLRSAIRYLLENAPTDEELFAALEKEMPYS